jgi:AhpD family alkylhydroperoxidase
MARIQGVPLDTRNPLLRLVFWVAHRRFGQPVEPLQGYARNGAVLAAMTGLEIGMERATRLDMRLKQLAELRVAALVGCRFCLDIGSALVAKIGVTPAQVRELNDYEASAAFSALEKVVLRYADRMTETPVEIDDHLVSSLLAHMDEAQLVELTAAIAHENLRARMNHALGYDAAGFAEGGVCALPAQRKAPLQERRVS